MQFKTVKNRIQVIAYMGYDKDKKRAVTKLVGSLSRFTYQPSDGLMESLTVEQREEVQSYIDKCRQSDNDTTLQSVVKHAACHINKIADGIDAGLLSVSDGWDTTVWQAIERLSKSMKSAGFAKPKREPKATEVPDGQGKLVI